MNIDEATDLTRPPFTLTIGRDDDGQWRQQVDANGVPLIIGLIGLLTALEAGMEASCPHIAAYARTMVAIRNDIATHVSDSTHVGGE